MATTDSNLNSTVLYFDSTFSFFFRPAETATEGDADADGDADVPASALMPVLDFLRCLRHPSEDGRVVRVRKPRPSQSHLKYLLLNPASLFRDFVQQPRYAHLLVFFGHFCGSQGPRSHTVDCQPGPCYSFPSRVNF